MPQNFTLPSLPGVVAGLKNPENVTGEFVYNFFMADERVSEVSQVSPEDNVTDQAYFASRIGKVPRYVKLSFTSNVSSYKNLDIKKLASEGAPIMFEDAPFNQNLSSIVVADTVADSRAYLLTSASVDIFSGSEESSETGTYLGMLPREREIVTTSKSFLFNSLNNIQSAGYQYASTDANQEVRSQFLRNVKGFSAGLTLNNLFIDDITAQILKNENSIFADEFAAARDRSSQIQQVSRNSTNPFRRLSDAYDLAIPYYSYRVLPGIKRELLDTNASASLVGYCIEKYGQNSDGSVEIYDTIYVNSSKTVNEFLDPNVRYGGLYSYVVRSLYEVEVYVAAETSSGRTLGIAQAKMLFATSGVNVDIFCEETVPPPPPEEIYFKLMPDATLMIGWVFPLNMQRDTKKFQIFRRKSLDLPFELIQELDFDDSIVKSPSIENVPVDKKTLVNFPTCFYVDSDFDVNSKFIYSIVSVDAHGYTSNYSTQFEVSVNIFTESLVIRDVVRKGCPKPYPNLFINTDFFSDLIKDSGHTQMSIYFNPDYTDLVDVNGELVNLIQYSPKDASYKIHILETNLAQDQILDIKMTNEKIARTIPISEAKVYTQVI